MGNMELSQHKGMIES